MHKTKFFVTLLIIILAGTPVLAVASQDPPVVISLTAGGEVTQDEDFYLTAKIDINAATDFEGIHSFMLIARYDPAALAYTGFDVHENSPFRVTAPFSSEPGKRVLHFVFETADPSGELVTESGILGNMNFRALQNAAPRETTVSLELEQAIGGFDFTADPWQPIDISRFIDTEDAVFNIRFIVPPTGLPGVTATTAASLMFLLISAVLWAYVLCRKLGRSK